MNLSRSYTPTAPTWVRSMMALQFFVAIFYLSYIFVASPEDINNPTAPTSFKIIKDFIAIFAIGLPLVYSTLFKNMKIPLLVLLYILYPIILITWDIMVSVNKIDITEAHMGIFKNYAFYYSWSALLVVMAKFYRVEIKLFNYFRIFFSISTLIGLALYFISSMYTSMGRMVGTLGNPNAFGYVCVLYLSILHGLLYYQKRLTKLQKIEMGLIFIGMILSVSITALVTYFVFLLLLFFLISIDVFPPCRALMRLISLEILVIVGVTTSIVSIAYVLDDFFSTSENPFMKLSALVSNPMDDNTSTSVTARIFSYQLIFDEILKSYKSFFFGSLQTSTYFEWDSSLVNIAYNYGIISLVLWLTFFFSPILCIFVFRKILRRNLTQATCLSFVLAIFLLTSILVNFTLQYSSEKYPTSFFVGWIMAFMIVHICSLSTKKLTPSLSNDRRPSVLSNLRVDAS